MHMFSFFFPFSLLLCFVLFFSQSAVILHSKNSIILSPADDSCAGRYIYVQNLPHQFNSDILRDCIRLSMDVNMCKLISNSGFGPRDSEAEGILSITGWYLTNQHILEVIFHNRMKQYPCLTTDSSIATAVFVPFYVGLDISRYLIRYNISVRDSLSMELLHWIRSTPEWKAMGGRDHFLVSGRVTWDLRRQEDDDSLWGNKFLLLPEAKNMTILSVESYPWTDNEFAIPYPTCFHPSMESELLSWQEKVRSMERPWLFSFMGKRRSNQVTSNIRDRVVDQCSESTYCKLQECGKGKKNINCRSPSNVITLFQSSLFCLQPRGDSFARRSTFDSILAGCILVFFNKWSAYDQYKWYLPGNYTKYSVYIPEEEVREGRVKIEQVLLRYSGEQVREMREEVIKIIPLIVYRDTSSKLGKFRDAFDVAIDGVIERMRGIRNSKSLSL